MLYILDVRHSLSGNILWLACAWSLNNHLTHQLPLIRHINSDRMHGASVQTFRKKGTNASSRAEATTRTTLNTRMFSILNIRNGILICIETLLQQITITRAVGCSTVHSQKCYSPGTAGTPLSIMHLLQQCSSNKLHGLASS